MFCADLDAFAHDAPLWGGAAAGEGEAPWEAGAASGEGPCEAGAGPCEAGAAAAGAGEWLREALARALTDKQREVVEMHFFEGLSQGEIARRLGVSQQVVQKRLHGDRRAGKTVGGALPRLREALRAPGSRP
ncbi:MAG TPA: sigma factor-like helix-turn-helix DNA-binding protein [Polyangiaceae bacterium]|nr:sigma factor-like helix-turn-helix DNA-binding protein [Polyangiaceae bacterium]